MEGSLVAYKVFTNGSTLQASELNENLMQQATAVFSNAAARTAAITSPVEGQLTYLEDLNRYENYNGTAWVRPIGMTLVGSTTFSGVSGASLSANTFSSLYRDYKVIMEITTSANPATLQYRLQVGGDDDTTNNYQSANAGVTASGTVISLANTNQTIGSLLYTTGSGNLTALDMTVYSPSVAAQTTISGTGFGTDSTAVNWTSWRIGGKKAEDTAFDNISFYVSTGTMTGRLSIYGLGI